MFKVSFIVDDKKLPSVLHRLAGQTFDMTVNPVTNLDFDANGSPKAKHANGKADISELRLPAKGSRIRPKLLKSLLPSIGWSAVSVTYALKALLETKRLKKLGNGLYEVL